MHWNFIPLDINNTLRIPLHTFVVAVRDHEKLIDYGNGLRGPERRIIVSLDRWDGLEWLHEGSGHYIGYFPIDSVLQWDTGRIIPERRYLVRVAETVFIRGGDRTPIPKGIYLAKVGVTEYGYDWQCYQFGHRFKSSEDFIQKPFYINVPLANVSHWQMLPDMKNQYFS